jgi:hypothetical protein
LALKLRDLRGTRKVRWLGATCALSLVCACAFVVNAGAQASADADKAPSNKPVNPKKHAQVAAKASGTTSAASKHTAHSASHPPAGSHPKSNAAAASHSAASHSATTKRASSRKGKKTARGQQKIASDRAQEIQEALVREHYLSGEATGTWNPASEDAMRRYQADHGWQSKTVPDSRALISLGLGPSHDHLLNPESAMTTGPFAPRSASLTPASHSADPGVRMNTTPPADPAAATTPDHSASDPQ